MASPTFIAISCVILSFLQLQVVGVHIVSAITLSIFSIIAILYVDDSDILIAAKTMDESVEELCERAQQAADAYQIAVHQTGGAVRPDKCRCYIIAFQFRNGKYVYDKKSSFPSISIEDTNKSLSDYLFLLDLKVLVLYPLLMEIGMTMLLIYSKRKFNPGMHQNLYIFTTS